jgi:exodeoxyribonuclease-1
MAKSFYFYDLETFGLDSRCDRIAQFAGVRTDENLEITGERVILYCRPSPDYLPSPHSCLVTGITPQAALEAGVTEYELARAVHRELSEPGTTTLGYNTIQFDDEFVRNLFYRCFYDPYGREWRRGNSRWDLVDLMRAAHDLRPEGIVWPAAEDGTPIFRLEALAKANGVDQGAAHDAMHDVLATIGMARLVRSRQPKLFDWHFAHRGRDALRPLVDLVGREPLVHASAAYTSPRGCTTLVAPIALDPENRNQLIALDLRYDPEEVLTLPVEELRRRVFTKAEELEVPRLHLSRIKLNRCPFLAPQSTMSDEAALRLGVDRDACARHLEVIRREPELIQKLVAVFEGPKVQEEIADPDLRMYADGFFPDEDAELFGRIHETIETLPPAEAKAKLYRLRFRDERAPQMLRRFFARNFPETLGPAEMKRWKSFCATRLQLPLTPEGTDLATYAKIIGQKLEDPATPARDRGILLALLAYKTHLEKEVLGYGERQDRAES